MIAAPRHGIDQGADRPATSPFHLGGRYVDIRRQADARSPIGGATQTLN
jgi:hypothetical protein